MDSSAGMIAAAAAHADRAAFVQADVRDWQPGEPVDVVVSNAVLHWVPGARGSAGALGGMVGTRG